MTRAVPLLALLLAGACAPAAAPLVPVPPAQRIIPGGPAPGSYYFGSGEGAIEADLLATGRERFGEEAVRRTLAAPAYLMAKIYPGMLPPPEPGAAPFQPPMAMLVRTSSGWQVVTADGLRPAKAAVSAAIDALIASAAFRSTPATGRPSCTDSGAALLLLKLPQGAETIRDGTCGATEPNERLARLAVEA